MLRSVTCLVLCIFLVNFTSLAQYPSANAQVRAQMADYKNWNKTMKDRWKKNKDPEAAYLLGNEAQFPHRPYAYPDYASAFDWYWKSITTNGNASSAFAIYDMVATHKYLPAPATNQRLQPVYQWVEQQRVLMAQQQSQHNQQTQQSEVTSRGKSTSRSDNAGAMIVGGLVLLTLLGLATSSPDSGSNKATTGDSNEPPNPATATCLISEKRWVNGTPGTTDRGHYESYTRAGYGYECH